MSQCLMCGDETLMVINIKFKAKPLCNSCGNAITKQNVIWLCDTLPKILDNNSKQGEKR